MVLVFWSLISGSVICFELLSAGSFEVYFNRTYIYYLIYSLQSNYKQVYFLLVIYKLQLSYDIETTKNEQKSAANKMIEDLTRYDPTNAKKYLPRCNYE